MMKLKKIASSFVCLVILAAFTGAVSFEFNTTRPSKPRCEVSKANAPQGVTFLIESEESDPLNDPYQSVMLPALVFLPGFILFGISPMVMELRTTTTKISQEQLLFIRFKSLRL